MSNRTKSEANQVIRRALAADCACDEADFLSDRITIVRHELRSGSRGFQLGADPLQIVTMGAGVVVSCGSSRLEVMPVLVDGLSRDDCFNATMIGKLAAQIDPQREMLHGPYLRYGCAIERFRPAAALPDADIALLGNDEVIALVNHPDFPHALSLSPGQRGLRFLAAVAYGGSRLIAVAAAGEETEGLWQIGVDVLPGVRQRGLGQQLVSRVTEAIFENDGVPYYTAATSNLASRSTAIGLGYWPAWTDLYVTDRKRSAPE